MCHHRQHKEGILNASSNNQTAGEVRSSAPEADIAQAARTKLVHRCDFRLAGRLLNEDARAVTAVHETVAANLAALMDKYFGTAFAVSFDALNQRTVKDHVTEIASLGYVVPFSSGIATVEFSLNLVFPMVEFLLGGAGDGGHADRGLSEIEEAMMQDIVLLIIREVEAVWSIPGLKLQPGARIEARGIGEFLRPTEKVTALRFECRFANASGTFSLVLSTPLLEVLVQHLKANRGQEKSKTVTFPSRPFRERILNCDIEVTAELPQLKVRVKDLVSLEPGSVLKLRAPIQTPAMLTIGERSLFEATPVRSGPQRAAQLGRRADSNDWKRR
jgi:flagellar motor switch protein FliM